MRARTATFISALALASATITTGTAFADVQCPNGDAVPGTVADSVIQQATLCLLNEKRAAVGEVALTEQTQLDSAAVAYSQKMVAGQFFSHVAPDGSTMTQRVSASQYLTGYSSWVAGENIGWGSGTLVSPAVMVEAWMNSTEHRENILDGRYRDIGIGIAMGTPVPGTGPGVTYTNEFGFRDGLAPAASSGSASSSSSATTAASGARSTAVDTDVAAGATVGTASAKSVAAAKASKKAKKAKRAKRAKRARVKAARAKAARAKGAKAQRAWAHVA